MPSSSNISHVRYLYPGDGPPIRNAVLEWSDDRIVSARASDEPDDRFDDVAVFPHLINLHTHLEFQDLRTPLSNPLPFTGWIQDLIQHRNTRDMSLDQRYALGIAESIDGGCGAVADIATETLSEMTRKDLRAASRPRLLRFREVIGLTDERIEQQWDALEDEFGNAPRTSGQLQHGISPHAPYSVRFNFFEELIAHANSHSVPVAMHLAETPSERELIERGTGEFREMLTSFGLWSDGLFGSRTILDYLRVLAEAPRALVVHGNDLNETEIDFISEHPQLTVVYCPRTHAYFGHSPHPFQKIIAQGGRVAIGTDSRGSNPDISMWHELQWLSRQHPEMMSYEILRLATANAADALGWSDLGRLAVGCKPKWLTKPIDVRTFNPKHDLFLDPASP